MCAGAVRAAARIPLSGGKLRAPSGTGHAWQPAAQRACRRHRADHAALPCSRRELGERGQCGKVYSGTGKLLMTLFGHFSLHDTIIYNCHGITDSGAHQEAHSRS